MSLKWLPNALTLLRIAAAPVVGWLVYLASRDMLVVQHALGYRDLPLVTDTVHHSRDLFGYAAILFTLACLTDWLDGVLARRLNAQSELGAKLDLWADKALVAGVLIGLLPNSYVFAVIGLVCLTLRDLVIMRLRARRPDVNLKASFLAKSKTAIVMTGMALWLAGFPLAWHLADAGVGLPFRFIPTLLGLLLVALGCGLSLYTGAQYIRAARRAS